jgi:uncharacterized membrane protein YczE
VAVNEREDADTGFGITSGLYVHVHVSFYTTQHSYCNLHTKQYLRSLYSKSCFSVCVCRSAMLFDKNVVLGAILDSVVNLDVQFSIP